MSAGHRSATTGVGGLEWDDVRGEIDKHLGDASIPVLVYHSYVKDQAAEEPL